MERIRTEEKVRDWLHSVPTRLNPPTPRRNVVPGYFRLELDCRLTWCCNPPIIYGVTMYSPAHLMHSQSCDISASRGMVVFTSSSSTQ